MRFLFVLFFIHTGLSFAQVDSAGVTTASPDTTASPNPVVVVRTLEMEEKEYKVVYNYFYFRPYVAYRYFYNSFCNQKSNLLAQAFCYSVKEHGGYSQGIDVGYSFKNYNLLAGYSANTFFEKVNNYKQLVSYNNKYTVHQLNLKFLYLIKRKKITLAPFAGISYTLFAFSDTFYPAYDENGRITFLKMTDYQKGGFFLGTGGLEFRFFNTHRISPFITGDFTTSIFPEGNEKKYGVAFYRYTTSLSGGLLIKM